MDSRPANAAAPTLPLWTRLASRLPLRVLYVIAGGLVFLVHRVFRMRLAVVRQNIAGCFPELPEPEVSRIAARHYRQFGEMFAEIIASASMSPAELARRVELRNVELAQGLLGQGKPLLLVAAHQANWEWVLQVLATRLGFPLDVGYKPIRSPWAERAMHALRCRFGAHLVPAKDLLPDLLKRRHIVRGIAMLADQEPTTSEHQLWMDFLGRETAFYMGAGQMARAMRYPAVFVAMRRMKRGYYEIEFMPLASVEENLEPGEFTRRYAHLVEAEIRAAPTDWTWGHRRWKLKRGLYAG